MICVTVARTSNSALAEAAAAAIDGGAGLVELRLDHLEQEPDWSLLLADRRRPIVATCRRPQDGGRFFGDEAARLALLTAAMVAGVDWVDVEDDVCGDLPAAGQVRRLVSHHDLLGTPSGLDLRVAAMGRLGADAIKVVTKANRLVDNLTLLRLCASEPAPAIAFCMGSMGLPSRLLAGRHGAPWTYAAPDDGPLPAAGQPRLADLVGIYDYSGIRPSTALLAVAGEPISHSLSPLAHNAAISQLALDCRYLPLHVTPDDLADLLPFAEELGIAGLSITLPHKRAILAYLEDSDTAVARVGACNTACWRDGGWRGANTDLSAALKTIRRLLDVPSTAALNGRRALILGAGGVARTIAMGLLDVGADVLLASRDHGRRRDLAADLGCEEVPWSERDGAAVDLMVNCTPVGMFPKVEATPFAVDRLRPTTAVFDTVYRPRATALITGARARGCAVAGGVDMFVDQAALQFMLFTGRPAPTQVMRRAVERALDADEGAR